MSRSSSLNEEHFYVGSEHLNSKFISVLVCWSVLNTQIIGTTSGAIGGKAVFSQRIMLDFGANGLLAADL
jgi:hypothetical protein|tara:strand:+ start:340 stop:549 length:210 start_codon:yes stop_codon:yes gene_type:complete